MNRNLLVILGLLLLLALVIVAIFAAKPSEPTEAASLEGTITAVSQDDRTIVVTRRTLHEDAGEFSISEIAYTVRWNDDTVFFEYTDAAAVEADAPNDVEPIALQTERNARVLTTEKDGANRTALEIYLLPGSARAEVVE